MIGYLDESSIEFDTESGVWRAFYMDQDGGEVGERESDSADGFDDVEVFGYQD